MPLINTIIPVQAFERIRDRIAEILLEELTNQAQLTGDLDIQAKVFLERSVPFEKTSIPAVNVCFIGGTYGGQTAIHTEGNTYNYAIDVHHAAKSTQNDPGDSLSAFRLHKLLGKCRAILEDPRYKTLGFEAPFIMNRHVQRVDIADYKEGDALSMGMGRLTFAVRVAENADLIVPELIDGADTVVKLGNTDKGFAWSGGNINPKYVLEFELQAEI